jgi:[acyl-carrier-protein] S-malonyltransferase
MEPARAWFESFLAGVEFRSPQLTVLTNTTGKAVSDPAAIREALVKQVVSPVLWEDCMREAARVGATKFIECGPGGVLAGLAKRTDRDWPVTSLSEAADLAQA